MRVAFCVSLAGAFLALVGAAACSGSSGNSSPATADAGADGPILDDGGSDAAAAAEAEASSMPYPAPHAPMPLVQYNGGPLLVSEQIVSITFPGEALKTSIEAFDDSIAQTAYWTQTTSEYCEEPGSAPCVGKGGSGGHVVMHAMLNKAYSSAQMAELIRGAIVDGTLPPPQKDILYALYLPQDVTVNDPGFASCVDFGAYHSTVDVTIPAGDAGVGEAGVGDAGAGTTTTVAFAVMMRCYQDLSWLTRLAGHEFAEAATDPTLQSYFMFGPWGQFFHPEIGDLCERESTISVDGFTVQRLWSNASAKAGHDPCVPAPAEPYFAAAPQEGMERITLGIGESKTIEVQAFSEAPTVDWSLDAVDYDAFRGGQPMLGVSLDTPTANNGTVAKLTVTLLAAPNAARPFGVYAIVSSRGQTVHYWPAEVLPK